MIVTRKADIETGPLGGDKTVGGGVRPAARGNGSQGYVDGETQGVKRANGSGVGTQGSVGDGERLEDEDDVYNGNAPSSTTYPCDCCRS